MHTVGNVPHAPVVVLLGNPRVSGKKLGVMLEKAKLDHLQVTETRKERDEQLVVIIANPKGQFKRL